MGNGADAPIFVSPAAHLEMKVLHVHIGDILEGYSLSKNFTYHGPAAVRSLDLVSPLRLDLRITNAGSRVLVSGAVSTRVRQICSRCGESYGQALDVEVEEYAVPSLSPEAPDPAWSDLADLLTYSEVEPRLEFDEVVRQNLVAALPLQPLCHAGCRGLCGGCGRNLNRERCACPPPGTDPRWAPLLKFRRPGAGMTAES